MSSHHTNHSDRVHTRSPLPSRRDRREADVSPNGERVPLVKIHDEKPPLAGPETDDDLDDDRETVSKPYPGVDDGFFNGDGKDNSGNEGDFPVITSRAGPDGGSENPDEVDGPRKPDSQPGRFPYAPNFGPDLEVGSIVPDLDSIPDVNVYQHKKTLAQGMMDLALFSANANQLRYVLESFNRHPYYYPSIVLISFSLIFQVAVGIGLIWNSRYNVKDDKQICIANRINNFTIIGIFLVTVINVFISAFGVANAPTT
ncbi:ninjurin-A-like [Tribolium madens]|uniref:ninjurin-A-like n=1 Tax=Tribolium madens TaxID=41895 RepID=UPI001CF7594B|nr:ninjurin-A-like [Tribolium madens]